MAIDIDITKTKEDKIKEVLKQHFESEIRSDIGICSYLIFPDGTLVGSYAHRDCLDYLVDNGVLSEEEISQWDTDIFNEVFNCVRATDIDADENYIGLPENALTDAQYKVLEKWIDNNFSLGRPTLQVTAKFNTDNQTTAFYNYDEIIDNEWPTDYIIKKIKKYYNTGKLEEDLDIVPVNEDKEYILEEIKSAYDFCFNDLVVIVNGYLFDFEEGYYLNDIITIGDNGEVLKSTTGGGGGEHATIDTIQAAYNEDYDIAETIKFLKPWVEELKKHPEEFKPDGYYTEWIASFLWGVGGVSYMSLEDREEVERNFGITFDEFLDEDLTLNPDMPLIYPSSYRDVTEITPEDFEKIEEYFNNLEDNDRNSYKHYAKHNFAGLVRAYKDKIMSGEYIVFIGKIYGHYFINVASFSNKSGKLRSIPNAYVGITGTYGNDRADLYHDIINIIGKKEEDNLQEKIVKKGSKWQVQSEKGRNMGTYDTKEEAEKRLQQVHYFKYANEDLDLVAVADPDFPKTPLMKDSVVLTPEQYLKIKEFFDSVGNNNLFKSWFNNYVLKYEQDILSGNKYLIASPNNITYDEKSLYIWVATISGATINGTYKRLPNASTWIPVKLYKELISTNEDLDLQPTSDLNIRNVETIDIDPPMFEVVSEDIKDYVREAIEKYSLKIKTFDYLPNPEEKAADLADEIVNEGVILVEGSNRYTGETRWMFKFNNTSLVLPISTKTADAICSNTVTPEQLQEFVEDTLKEELEEDLDLNPIDMKVIPSDKESFMYEIVDDEVKKYILGLFEKYALSSRGTGFSVRLFDALKDVYDNKPDYVWYVKCNGPYWSLVLYVKDKIGSGMLHIPLVDPKEFAEYLGIPVDQLPLTPPLTEDLDLRPVSLPDWKQYFYNDWFDVPMDAFLCWADLTLAQAEQYINRFEDDAVWVVVKYIPVGDDDGNWEYLSDNELMSFDEAYSLFLATDLQPGDEIGLGLHIISVDDDAHREILNIDDPEWTTDPWDEIQHFGLLRRFREEANEDLDLNPMNIKVVPDEHGVENWYTIVSDDVKKYIINYFNEQYDKYKISRDKWYANVLTLALEKGDYYTWELYNGKWRWSLNVYHDENNGPYIPGYGCELTDAEMYIDKKEFADYLGITLNEDLDLQPQDDTNTILGYPVEEVTLDELRDKFLDNYSIIYILPSGLCCQFSFLDATSYDLEDIEKYIEENCIEFWFDNYLDTEYDEPNRIRILKPDTLTHEQEETWNKVKKILETIPAEVEINGQEAGLYEDLDINLRNDDNSIAGYPLVETPLSANRFKEDLIDNNKNLFILPNGNCGYCDYNFSDEERKDWDRYTRDNFVSMIFAFPYTIFITTPIAFTDEQKETWKEVKRLLRDFGGVIVVNGAVSNINSSFNEDLDLKPIGPENPFTIISKDEENHRYSIKINDESIFLDLEDFTDESNHHILDNLYSNWLDDRHTAILEIRPNNDNYRFYYTLMLLVNNELDDLRTINYFYNPHIVFGYGEDNLEQEMNNETIENCKQIDAIFGINATENWLKEKDAEYDEVRANSVPGYIPDPQEEDDD